ncbi:hypothetical protein JM946_24060 [Steroidobacter sp. S1-65]|uniref:SMP-30/Gluconolactonase/LRE-like region domain-containing protein n=1 Tax=Steroidobacter gossypii TaxID=2805490 RepID=A0ABS1X3L8_9GAMM|nr:hypothetical protein [Steroidobacter gossypii]MBM0107821.1 hypothetical protein [Steroidobacter gossypii]
MKALSSTASALVWMISLTGAALPSNAADVSDCPSDERAAYICNVRNAEDLVAVRDTAWVIAGRVTDPPTQGGFYLIDARSGAASPMAPDFRGATAPIYSECPGAPGKDEFAAHGIAIRYGTGSKHELYAVNHNGRESVEIFDLDVSGERPELIWKGCVVVPRAVMPNSVAPVSGGGFMVTSFGIRTDPETYQKALAGGISGFVAKWAPGQGWSEVPGTQFSANNGVALSEDGKRLFVTGWGDRKLHVVSLGEMPYTHQAVELGAVHPDNIRATDDGRLLIAGQAAMPADIFACTKLPTCEVGFKVIAVDPRSLSVEPLLDEPGSRSFGGASAAILVGNEIWVGTFNGSRIARYPLRK